MLYLKSTTSDHFLDQLRHDHAELLRAAWSQLFSEPSPSEILEVITLIEKSVNRLPVITLTLTYHPTRVQIKELASFIRSKINNQAILEFQFEPNLVGGLVVQAEGQNIDLSLRETLLHAKVWYVLPGIRHCRRC